MFYFVIGIIILLLLSVIGKIFSDKAQKGLSPKDKLLLIQKLTNTNKYSVSALIAISVIYFVVMRHLSFAVITIVSIFSIIAVAYIATFSAIIYKEVKELNLPAKATLSYTASKILLLIGLSVFLISLFIYFNSCCIVFM